ncbi:hypothetical protein IB633_06945 [Francisella philomiragia]|uniref:Uncharacterized protein n=1 Tax=Francisella philomiragia subsp. philomiragia (strain ATCC 25017 / CCUG 19701 / FSC 153 / O\|nr:hypothetical protein [Francisella philomiragia]AJI46754.1 hypothetical protein BF30_1212 [Francisella philomiragia]AJI50190.1 hypothetical protein KU46_345 [Francisella philomiragia]MBK2020868.1 hypothetical protein [Francisella philomiragia]MBK2030803.1 hypothetical protein [Francisella philomiragia]MBK2264878.1 hypothetical protein [Francisella philomiragia]
MKLLNVLDNGFLKIKDYTKEDRSFNNAHLEIAYTFRLDSFVAIIEHRTDCTSYIYLEKIASSYDELASIFYTQSSFIKEYLNSLQDHKAKPTTNQDDSYKYSQALNPYNDIIFAFDSEYQRLSNDNTRIQSTNHIQPWLKENYKDLKDHDIRVLNNLIQTHYKLKK